MLVVESSMAGGRKAAALAAMAGITAGRQAHGTTKAVSRRSALSRHSICFATTTQTYPMSRPYHMNTRYTEAESLKHCHLDAIIC